MSFTCRQCGKCCRDLVFKDQGIKRGLTLLPEEIIHFPQDKVRPYFGIGKRPYDSQFKVLAYQLTTMNCPHIINYKCSIYDERPTACRQYPFSLDPNRETGILLGVDMNCPAAIELISNSNSVIDFQDRNSAEKLLELKKFATENPRKSWIYDIESEKWIRYDKLD